MSTAQPPAPRDTLSDAKRALLERRLRGNAAATRIPRVADDVRVAPSHGQERILFLQSLYPESTAYNLHEAYRCLGPLDVDRLERALNAVAARHDALRLRFVADAEGWRLQVDDLPQLAIRRHDLSGLAGMQLGEAIDHFTAEQARIRFDLGHGPPLVLAVARIGPLDHVVCLTVHHVVTDEWSNAILWQDLAAAYSGRALDAPPVRYRDVVHFERDMSRADLRAEDLAFWRRALAPPLPVADLPTDFPRPVRSSQRGGFVRLQLEPDAAAAVRALSKRLGATVFMLGLAATAVLMHRHTGQDDVVIGTPIARRGTAETEAMIGFFLNTLALRLSVDPASSFEELVARAKSTASSAFAHAEVPFDEVVRHLQPARPGLQTPVFQVMFVHQRDQGEPSLPGIAFQPMVVDGGVSKFDLTFFLAERGSDIELAVEFDGELFERASAEALARRFGAILRGVAAEPLRSVGDLVLLDEIERRHVTRDWQGAPLDVPPDVPIHALFEERARQRPSGDAIITHAGRMSYAELNSRADRLADLLADAGVAPDAPVILCAHRSPEMIVGILGVLKAGGAYVPIDPSYPAERVAFVLTDTRASVVVAQAALAHLFRDSAARVIMLEGADGPERSPPSGARRELSPDALAYVIYTSGSTGQPKGVMVTHRNLVSSTLARFAEYERQPERFLLLSSFAFDSSVAGIFWTLCGGGALVLPPPDGEKDVRGIAAMISTHAVTHTLCLPSVYGLLLEFAAVGQLEALREVIVAGEACPAALVREHHRALPAAHLHNEYGPTEGTVWCTLQALGPDAATPVPIGRPIRNMQAHVVDARGHLAPVGVIGELLIGGAGIARGYWERPDLTRDRFGTAAQWIADSGADIAPAARMYRTGDRARWLADGTLQYFGRSDDQVKVRGHRIELGEVEHALRSIDGVTDAAATVQGEDLHARLIAFVVSSKPTEVLREALRSRVPEALVPTHIAPLAELPRLPNGKIDRAALATMHAVDGGRADASAAPNTGTERLLADIWRDVLGITSAGVDEDFFALGGHSLAAIRLVARIGEAFGTSTPVSALLANPTIAGLAALISAPRPEQRGGPVVTLRSEGSRSPFFCVHGFGGGVTSYRPMALAVGEDQPFYAFQARGFDNEGEPHDTIEDMAGHYIAAMKAIRPAGPYFLGGHCFGGVVAFEMARQLSAQGEAVGCVALFDAFTPVAPIKWRALAHPLDFIVNGARLVREIGPGYYARQLGRTVRRRAAGLLWRRSVDRALSLDDVLPNAGEIPDDIRRLTEAHLRAMGQYRIGPYAGTVDLFTVGTRPVFRAHERQNGWEAWALGGVRVWPIRGTHRTIILDAADAADLGRSLRACLDRAFARLA